ncbi:23S rRNA (uracil(1939)-C(5))-methyltransferase RlmD [Sedimentibacter sp.]|uniref:23S rRNA (uracil(1939)-C(5))-methyltransferase RlmD n=1 Tax=Sedimentibacter sp. TaxID=1960295 RepID=UPI0028A8853B|nr:23S rRNA (uracil(1939)-C(5))-methyltransferase RlmD [Sedimentibacter sp.]
MLIRGSITEVEIIDLNHTGQGVAKIDNFVVFVSVAITGDVVEIEITETKKNYAVGQIINIVKPSEFRIKSPCEHYEQCGGCQLMHMDYNKQLKYKKNRVINELNRADVKFEESVVEDTIGMKDPYRYRNKTAFSVTEKNNEILIGPYEQGTYNTVDISSCMLQSKEADDVVKAFKNLMIKYDIKAYDKNTRQGVVRNIVIRNNRRNELMLIIVTTAEKFQNKDDLVAEITSLVPSIKTVVQNINDKYTNLILGRKNITIYGEGTITDTIDDLIFTISPETFFQINPVQTEKLYQKAIQYADIGKDDICFDIYCGIGTISLMAAKKAKKVYGVEIVEQSIINARENAKKNNINNIEFFAGKAEIIVPKLYKQNIKADIVIVDPPRKGCEKEVIDTIINMSPKKVVYVSCNPSTLARDIKLLENSGYKLKKTQPVDQFPWTVHVETVILLRRLDA